MIEWRVVPGYERFSVTADGQVMRNVMRILRKDRWGRDRIYVWKARTCPIHKTDGYPKVSVSTGRIRKPAYVHRLVALAFVDGYQPGYHVNHIDGNKKNFNAYNLEWVTAIENTHHEWRTGLVNLRGERSPNARLTWRKVDAIRRALRKGVASTTLSIISGVSKTTIKKIRDGISWKSIYG